MLQEYRTPAPWCITHQLNYVEASNRDDGLTPLHVAVEQNKRKMVTRILEARARPDLVDSRGRTALMLATLWGFTESMASLLSHGASHDIQDACGRQALHYAAYSQNNTGDAIDILIAAKADVHARDANGSTPLMGGAFHQSKAAVDKLLRHGAGALQIDYAGQRALDYARLGRHGLHPAPVPIGAAAGGGPVGNRASGQTGVEAALF